MMELTDFIRLALQEDVGKGDITSLSTIPENKYGTAKLLVKEQGIIAGIFVGLEIIKAVDDQMNAEVMGTDGQPVAPGDVLLKLHGKVRSILQAERLLLNCMQRMSGIATTTRKYTDAVAGLPVKIMDTRKTTPLLRQLEKYAVKTGGGFNHRFGLYDMILIKDNHVDSAGGISAALVAARAYRDQHAPGTAIEIETRSFTEIEEALSTGIADRIMFDNFSVENTIKAVALVNNQCETESSGGITLNNVRAYAETGVNCISVGALTHSVKSLDLSLKIHNE
ncbi:MAG: carboxylating nicotinate-nucleotide diphosphorylase [Bacteroidia bacterium]